MKIKLDEGSAEFKLIKAGWAKRAKDMTIDELPEFLKELTEKYSHDYGTICHAVTAAAISACWAMNKSEQGGITGFQAGAIMWEFIREWNHSGNKIGLRMVDYDNFLYPQYEDKFDKVLSSDVWANLQKESKTLIEKADKDQLKYIADLNKYNADIEEYVTKYPDYYDNKKHYDPLGMGTGGEWVAEEEKKKSGFEFAPQKPYEMVGKDSPAYIHWQSIVGGNIPFGYSLEV